VEKKQESVIQKSNKSEQSKKEEQDSPAISAPQDREQAVSLIKHNKLSKLERIDKLLDRMVYITIN